MKDFLLTRRQFGKTAAGILVTFTLAPELAFSADQKLPGSLGTAPMLDAWVMIGKDGKATIFTGKVELGQGVLTALSQIAAEELDLPMSQISIVSGDTRLTPDEGYTTGSQTIEYSGTALRFACAEARSLLIEKASATLGVPADRLKTADGAVLSDDGRKLTYAEIAKDNLLHHKATAKTAPKPASQHTIVGKPIGRIDIPAKLTGVPSYVQDMRMPGMVFGRIVRPPGPRDRLETVDAAAVKRMPGVLAVVRDGSFLGVVASREEQAIAAMEALQKAAKWRIAGDLPDSANIYAWLKKQASVDEVISGKKPLNAPQVAKRLDATYTKGYVAHAAIGPSCAIAVIKDRKLQVWTHSQGVYPLRGNLATVMKMEPEDVSVSHVEGSGCYGHNGADDAALDAALLAREVPGSPVKVQWMRDDEFAWSPFGSAMMMQASAGLAADGTIVDWQYELWSNAHSGGRPGRPGGVNLLAAWHLAKPFEPSPPRSIPVPPGAEDRNALPIYDFPSQNIVRHLVKEAPLRTSALRALGAYANVFAIESFMDELAAAAGIDPIEFRLRHLKDARARAVIEMAAAKAGWKAGFKSDGTKGRGFGFAKYKNLACYFACVADVEIDRKTGEVKVRRVVGAADAGQIINPKGLAMQLEGGIIQSVSWTLKEAVTFDKAKVTSRDWSGYPILTFAEVPEIEVHLIDRPEERSLGSGEASLGPTAAAVVNAVSVALGRRIRNLPISKEPIKEKR
jgi:CO/xanthine dehydrogenase Mo-binding subunit